MSVSKAERREQTDELTLLRLPVGLVLVRSMIGSSRGRCPSQISIRSGSNDHVSVRIRVAVCEETSLVRAQRAVIRLTSRQGLGGVDRVGRAGRGLWVGRWAMGRSVGGREGERMRGVLRRGGGVGVRVRVRVRVSRRTRLSSVGHAAADDYASWGQLDWATM